MSMVRTERVAVSTDWNLSRKVTVLPLVSVAVGLLDVVAYDTLINVPIFANVMIVPAVLTLTPSTPPLIVRWVPHGTDALTPKVPYMVNPEVRVLI